MIKIISNNNTKENVPQNPTTSTSILDINIKKTINRIKALAIPVIIYIII